VDEVILSHTNQTEFDKFKSSKENEALHDRMYPIFVPYNLRLREEEKIYKKMIERSEFRTVHLAPHTLTITAQFAILSRLAESQICPNPIKKMKYYNGEAVTDKEKDQVDLLQLYQEEEGDVRDQPRFVVNALNVALGRNRQMYQSARRHPGAAPQFRTPYRVHGGGEDKISESSDRGKGQCAQ
jgi:serine protein kinase